MPSSYLHATFHIKVGQLRSTEKREERETWQSINHNQEEKREEEEEENVWEKEEKFHCCIFNSWKFDSLISRILLEKSPARKKKKQVFFKKRRDSSIADGDAVPIKKKSSWHFN